MPNAIKVTFDDAQIRAWLGRARKKTGDLSDLLRSIGEDLKDSTQRRFSTATAPDGAPWAPNTETTILLYLGLTKGNTKKDGSLSKKGQARLGAKKPLTGQMHHLRDTIFYRVAGNTLEVGSPEEYSAVQQFGAAKGSLGGGAPWGDIPARPFLGLSTEDRATIEQSILDYLDIT